MPYFSSRYALATGTTGPDTLQYPSYDDAGRLLQRVDGNGLVTKYVDGEPGGALTAVT